MDEGLMEKSEKAGKWHAAFHINRKLIPMKLFLLLHYGGFAALYPYLGLHIKSIGISDIQIGLMFAIYPVVTYIGGPLAGVIGDKSGRFKLTLILMHVLSAGFHLLILFAVPLYRVTNIQTDQPFTQLQVHLSCDPAAVISRPFHFNASDGSGNNCTATGVPGNLHDIKHCIVRCGSVARVRDCSGDRCGSLYDEIRDFIDVSRDPTLRIGNQSKAKAVHWAGECGPRQNCTLTCDVVGAFTVPCYQQKTEGSQMVTFAVYITIRMLCGMVITVAFTIIDASLIQMVEDFNGDVGMNKAFILVGFCVMPPISGWLIDTVSRGKQQTDYSPAFFIFTVCMGLSGLVMYFTDLRVRKPAKNLFRNAAKLLRFPRVVAFLSIYGFLGIGWGFLETFLFLFLEKHMKAPRWFLGLTNTVGGLSGIPFAMGATWLLSKVGYTNMFVLGVFIFGLRFVGYALVKDIWWVLPFEALEAFTGTLPMTAATVYASTFSSDLIATLQGVNSAIHYGIGRGIGSLMGGYMIAGLGYRKSFLVMAGLFFGYAVGHFLLHFFYLRRLSRPRRTPTITQTPDSDKEAFAVKEKEAVAAQQTQLHVSEFRPRRVSILPDLVPADVEWGSHLALDAAGLPDAPLVKESENLLVHRRHSMKEVL